MSLSSELKQIIENDIRSHKIMVYMKGTPEAPQCGFSAQVVRLLEHFGASYETKNILDDEDLRQGIKEFSNWPTIPQTYINGSFVGGCDILMEMAESGDLENLLATLKD